MKNASNHEQQLAEENTLTTNNKNRSKNAFTGNTYNIQHTAMFRAIFYYIQFFLCSLNGLSKSQQQKKYQFQYYENSLQRAFNVFARISKIVLCHGAQCEKFYYTLMKNIMKLINAQKSKRKVK